MPRRARRVVPRARLDRRLDRRALPALVLVSAPAGFGKTTLLTEWLAGDGTPLDDHEVAWLSLDRRDSDPAVFWSYVIAALRKVAPGIGADALATLQASASSSAPSALEAVVAALLNGLAALDHDVTLVLDDYHLVESVAVHESMRFLLAHVPASFHLVVATRADPPLPLARLRARGELLEVRAADLRFTTDEAASYLNDAMDLALTAQDVAALERRTEGWIAALQLAALSLRDRTDASAFVAAFAGDDRFVVDYLADEVLDRQPAEVHSFLLETSILNRLSAAVCAAVTARPDARTILDALDRSNLFVVALDSRREWFRYHHLFADVLRARLSAERPDVVPTLHLRASEWFEADGDRFEAVRHALAAGDHQRAADLIERTIPALRQSRQDATLRAWLEALPPEAFVNRPVLRMALVGARMVTGEIAGVDTLLDGIEAWLASDHATDGTDGTVVHDREELARLPTHAAMYRAALALLRGDLSATVVHAGRAAAFAGDDEVGRGAAAALAGLAHWTRGDLAPAQDRYEEAVAAFERARYLADILGCSLGLADIQVAQGRLGAAERTLRAGLDLALAHAPLRGTADMHVGLAEIHLERDELVAAEEHLAASLAVGEHLALGQHAHRWRVVDARLHAARGDFATAFARLREAEARYDTDYSPRVRPVAATTARVQLAAGAVDAAAAWASASGLSVADDVTYLREYEQLTLARLLVATGRAHEAAALADRVLVAAEAGGRVGRAVDALVVLSLAHQAAGDVPTALVALADALHRAAPERFVRVFLDEGEPMTALLRTAVRGGHGGQQAVALLAAATLDGPASAPVPASAPASAPAPSRPARPALVDPLSARELDVLRLLRTELTGPEIAAELVVSLNTVRSHTKAIFSKLGVTNRRSAVRRADELGL